MKKALLGLAIIIIIGAGAYFLTKPNGALAPAQMAGTNTPAGMPSLSTLVAAGSPVTCTFSTTTANGASQGTMYIANGMVAGDFTTNTPQGGTVDSHVLVRDSISYLWTSLSATGFKSTVTATSSGSSSGHLSVGYSTPMDYACQVWTVDSNKFMLPTNITFITTSSYTAPSQGAGATGAAPAGAPKGTAAQCAQCNALPSAQKAQCIAALQC